MQPPPRGNASSDEVVERIRAWAKRPTAEATLAICDELRRLGAPEVRGNHVDVLAKAIMQRHAKSAPVLIALGRLQLEGGVEGGLPLGRREHLARPVERVLASGLGAHAGHGVPAGAAARR